MTLTLKAEEPAVVEEQGIVIYTDGGARGGNPGYGGYGIHGYLYSKVVPKKGTGCPNNIHTANGYKLKSDPVEAGSKDTVTPKHYIDGFGSFAEPISNNVAEIYGAIYGMLHALEYCITDLLILTDSEYVKKGFDSWAESWKRNGWTKQDGSIPANVDLWKRLLETRDRLIQRGVKVRIEWVRGHNDDLGNEMADRLATIGVMASTSRQFINCMETSPVEGYWKYSPNRHPFLFNRRMYFNTIVENNIPGEYYLGDNGKDDDGFGTRISDGAYAVVILKEPDEMLEFIRNHQTKIAAGNESVIMARLDQIYKPEIHKELTKYTSFATVRKNNGRLDLFCVDDEPLTREFMPPKLAMRGVEAIESIAIKLKAYTENATYIIKTDLTPMLFNTVEKTDKKGNVTSETVLNPEINVGYASLPVAANYKHGDEIKQATITLTLGIDLLDRNALKRLEEHKPKVTLITWLEAENVFRYAVIIESGNDIGIWCSVHSNLRMVQPEEAVVEGA